MPSKPGSSAGSKLVPAGRDASKRLRQNNSARREKSTNKITNIIIFTSVSMQGFLHLGLTVETTVAVPNTHFPGDSRTLSFQLGKRSACSWAVVADEQKATIL